MSDNNQINPWANPIMWQKTSEPNGFEGIDLDIPIDIPSLKSLTSEPITQFMNDEDISITLADEFGITTDQIFNKGTQIGLSIFETADNVDLLRSALVLEQVTDNKLDGRSLDKLYQASVNNDTDMLSKILEKKEIKLPFSITEDDIIELVQGAKSNIFKSAYLN